MINLKIKVTKDILEKSKYCGTVGGPSTTSNCAIALAVRDIFPLAEVYLLPSVINVNGSKDMFSWNCIELPTDAIQYVKRFDTTLAEERINLPEFEFEVSVNDNIIERINIDELRPLLQNHPTLELIAM